MHMNFWLLILYMKLFCYAGGVNEEVVAAIAEREHERRLPRVRSCLILSLYINLSVYLLR